MTVQLRAASPAFQFYPSDFMTGAPARMTPEETHVYVWLLCLDWETIGFKFDEKSLAHYCRLTRPRFRKAWATVSASFVERDGRMYNPRLERERKKQEAWRKKSSEGGHRSAAKRKGGATTPPTNGQPNGNHPSNHPTNQQGNQRSTLQTTSTELRSNSNLSVKSSKQPPPFASVGGEAGADGARTREQDELDDINRRRDARGDEPLDAL